jgi:hypothetical protein
MDAFVPTLAATVGVFAGMHVADRESIIVAAAMLSSLRSKRVENKSMLLWYLLT